MELLKALRELLALGDTQEVTELALKLIDNGTDVVSPVSQKVALGLEIADWLIEQQAFDRAERICQALSAICGSEDAAVQWSAEIADRLAEIEEATGHPTEAAECWERTVRSLSGVEGYDSDAALWRAEAGARARELAGQGLAAQETFQRTTKLRVRRDQEFADGASTPGRSARGQGAEASFELVKVYFATHRNRTGRSNPYDFFRGKRNTFLTYGETLVSVPKKRELGSLSTPPRWMEDRRIDPAQYFVVKTISVYPAESDFFEKLRRELKGSKQKEALIFIHGYNMSFVNALVRTAQLTIDLQIDGCALCYSWPSKGSVLSYLMDRNEAIKPIAEDLRKLIEGVVEETGASRIHLIAHSMGGEFILRALELQSNKRRRNDSERFLSELIFFAPDVDLQDFASRLQDVRHLADRVTAYTSAADLALQFSQLANGEKRAGSQPVPAIGVESIDITNLSRRGDIWGHDLSVIDDMRAIIWLSLAPSQRRLLRERRQDGIDYWEYDSNLLTPQEREAFAEAVVWAGRRGLAYSLEHVSQLLKSSNGAERRERLAAINKELEYMRLNQPDAR